MGGVAPSSLRPADPAPPAGSSAGAGHERAAAARRRRVRRIARNRILAFRRPLARGWIHLVSTPVVAVLGTLLFAFTDSAKGVFAVSVFTGSSIVLFGMSALYHIIKWEPRAKAVLRRVDHANIFLLIAGTYTPLALLALQPAKGWLLFGLVWCVALVGLVFNVIWISAPRWLYVALYLGTGWIAVMYLGDLLVASVAMMVLIAVGGLVYTLGAVGYALKHPNPWPRSFGFHEFFHAATAVAWLCHWTAILLIVLDPVSP